MEFNSIVRVKLFPILENYGFKIREELENIIRFASSKTRMNLAFNKRDKSHLFEIGKLHGNLFPLSDKAVVFLFGIDLKIDNVTSEVFVNNLLILFDKKEGIDLLNGNVELLEKFVEMDSNAYTFELVQRQAIQVALEAWANKDYGGFIKNIDSIGIDKLSQSIKLKYKIAKQELSG